MSLKDDLLIKVENSSAFFGDLLHLWREDQSGQDNSKRAKKLVIDLNQSDGIDLCDLGSQAIDDGFPVFDVIHVLEEAIPYLNINIETFIGLLEKLYEGTQNDLAAHLQYKPINKLVETQPELSRAFLDRLIDIDRPFVVGYITHLFQSFAKDNEQDVFKELDDLTLHESSQVVSAVVNVLGNLNYKPKENQTLLKRTFQIFDDIEKRNLEGLDACIANACGNLLEMNRKASRKLVYYSNKNIPDVDYAISRVLFLDIEKYGGEEWFEKLLMSLTRTRCEHKGIIKNLDYVLSALIKKEDNRLLAESFFVKWIETSDYKIREEKLHGLFGSTFLALLNHRENLQKFITRLFNHDSYKAHNAASEIINFCNLHELALLKLDRKELAQLELQDLLYIGRKILGYLIDSRTQCSLTLSLLDKSPRNNKIQSLVHSIFVDHIGRDYPGSTIEFLKHEVSTSKSKIKRDLAESVIAHIERDQAARTSLPHIREIVPPSQQTRQILLEQNKVMSRSMEKAQKGSIVNLFKKIPIKHGLGSFSYMNDDYMPVSKLSEHSAYMELPASEMSHPVYAAIERAGFRRAKKGD